MCGNWPHSAFRLKEEADRIAKCKLTGGLLTEAWFWVAKDQVDPCSLVRGDVYILVGTDMTSLKLECT
jgi:hypothetical protein